MAGLQLITKPFSVARPHQRSLSYPLSAPSLPRRVCVAPSALLGGLKKTGSGAKSVKRETIIPEPSFNLQLGLLALAGLSYYENVSFLAGFFGLLGVFLTIQATRVRFVFDDEGLSVKRAGQETENVFVGGTNKWTYDSFINWEFWWPGFPILVYFKESQTKPEGQIHFFPVIFNGKQVYETMVERCGPSKTSGPKN